MNKKLFIFLTFIILVNNSINASISSTTISKITGYVNVNNTSETDSDIGVYLNANDNSVIEVQFISPTIARIQVNKPAEFNSYAVIINEQGLSCNVEESDNKLSISPVVDNSPIILINKFPFSITANWNDISLFSGLDSGITIESENGISTSVTNQIIYNEDIYLYGLGDKTSTSIRRKKGEIWELFNSDRPYLMPYDVSYVNSSWNTVIRKNDPQYKAIPLLYGTNNTGSQCYGLFFDNTYQTIFDIAKTNSNAITYIANGGYLNFYIIFGNNLKEIITSYSYLTGKTFLPPLWSLGYSQCRWQYVNSNGIVNVYKNFRSRNIPCDVIWFDIDHMNQHVDFTSVPQGDSFYGDNSIENLAELVDDLHDSDFKVVSIVDPGIPTIENANGKGISNYQPQTLASSYNEGNIFVKNNDKTTNYEGNVWPGACNFPDFTNEITRAWWGECYKYDILTLNVDGTWNDMNEPSIFDTSTGTMPGNNYLCGPLGIGDSIDTNKEYTALAEEVHNVYGHTMIEASQTAFYTNKPTLRPFVLTRDGYAGMQRYAATWTGDNCQNIPNMMLNIEMVLSLGLSGIPLSGADIGGFAYNYINGWTDISSTPSTTYENWSGSYPPMLLVRWMQMGALLPFYRNHATDNSQRKEPWIFGPYFAEYCKFSIELRYHLMPYIYSLIYDSHANSGLPMARPLFLEFPNDPNCYNEVYSNNQFMVGPNILFAPVLPSALDELTRTYSSVTPYFPGDNSILWYDFFGIVKSIPGGTLGVTIYNRDFLPPIFIKSGSVIPTMEPNSVALMRKNADGTTSSLLTEQINLKVYPFASGRTSEIFTVYTDDGVSKIRDVFKDYTITHTPNNVSIAISSAGNNASKPLLITVVDKKSVIVNFNDIAIEEVYSLSDLLDTNLNQGFYYNPIKNETIIKVPETISWNNQININY